MSSTTATRIREISLVCVPCLDQDRSIEFYVESLGFEKRTDVTFGDGNHPDLQRREPNREGAAIVLDQKRDEALVRAERRPVDHVDRPPCAVCRHGRVHLHTCGSEHASADSGADVGHARLDARMSFHG